MGRSTQAFGTAVAVVIGFVISDLVSFSTLSLNSDIVWNQVALDAAVGFPVAFVVAFLALSLRNR